MDTRVIDDSPRPDGRGGGWLLGLLLAATFLIRLIHIDQPIVENYVGRQVPTAMVARNHRAGLGAAPAAARYGAVPQLLPGRAAAV